MSVRFVWGCGALPCPAGRGYGSKRPQATRASPHTVDYLLRALLVGVYDWEFGGGYTTPASRFFSEPLASYLACVEPPTSNWQMPYSLQGRAPGTLPLQCTSIRWITRKSRAVAQGTVFFPSLVGVLCVPHVFGG